MFDTAEYNRLRLSSMEDHFWDPLSPDELWVPFVHCMMTCHTEYLDKDKYNHILFVEFCEWIPRVAFRYYELKYYDLEKEKLEEEYGPSV